MNKSIYNKTKEQCCGCTACESVCPAKAITMNPDKMGFLYPVVDGDKCTNCGLCSRTCAFKTGYDVSMNLPEPIAYAARMKCSDQLSASQSGGAFAALSDIVLSLGGIVYGAGYAEHFRVVHKRAVTVAERDSLRKSKYVQSDMRGIFHMVKEDLRADRWVLFSGTACQCAGLRSYISPRLREKLFLVDIICHGVPSPYVWQHYLTWLEKKYKGSITAAIFRDKVKFGWRYHPKSESYLINDSWQHGDLYTYLFYNSYMMRESCHVCPYTNTKRPSDVTIGDMWGVAENAHEMVADNKGCSCILINTSKGRSIVEQCKTSMVMVELHSGEFLQPNLCNPTWRNSGRYDFERDFAEKGFDYVIKHYGNEGWRYKLRQWRAKSKLMNFAKRVLRKVKNMF